MFFRAILESPNRGLWKGGISRAISGHTGYTVCLPLNPIPVAAKHGCLGQPGRRRFSGPGHHLSFELMITVQKGCR